MRNLAGRPSAAIGSTVASSSWWKKLKRWLNDWKWPLIGFMWVVAIALGYVGFSKHFSAIGEPSPPWNTFYLTLQLFILESGAVSAPLGWELQIARFLAPTMFGLTALLALAIILHEQFQRFRVQFFKDHIVICGLGREGLALCEGFRKRGERVVAIEQDRNNDRLGQCREHGAIAFIGSATDPGLLRRARVHRAKYVISVCGDDGVNAEVAFGAREVIGGRRGKALSCLVHIYDPQLYNLVREWEMGQSKLAPFRLEFFNVFESGARVLLEEHPPFGQTGERRGSRPHVVVVGVGRMGTSVVVNAARKWQETNSAGGERLRVTLIDKDAERIWESLCLRYPEMQTICELLPKQMDVGTPEFERGEFLFDHRGCCDVGIVYVCLDNDSKALGAALALHQRIRSLGIPIVVRMTYDAGLATLLRENEFKSLPNVHAFGLLDRTCTPELIHGCTYEILARAIHKDYVRHEEEKGRTPETNPSMAPWEKLPETLKESNKAQAQYIRDKLRAIGYDVAVTSAWEAERFEFSPEDVEEMAKMEHKRFVKEREREGFRYGPVKDLEKATSPTLVPWDQLPEEERQKDRDSARGMAAFLAGARFQIYRLQKEA